MNDVTNYSDRSLDDFDLNLSIAVEEADFVLMKKYQYELSKYPVIEPDDDIKSLEITKNTRLFYVESIAYDKEEDNFVRLSNIYNALSAASGSVVVILDSNGEQVDFYIGTKTIEEKDVHVAYKTLDKSLQGNFPGCVVKNQVSKKIKRVLDNLFVFRDESSVEVHRVVSAVNGISSVREISSLSKKREFSQGIEKLIDSMRGEVYSVVLIADPVEQKQIDVIRSGYEQLYTKLVPFATSEISLGYNDGKTLTDSITQGTADTISESLTLSQSNTRTKSTSSTKSSSKGIAFFASYNRSKSTTKAVTDSNTESRAETKGTSNTKSLNLGMSNTISSGESRSVQIRTEEKAVKSLLNRIDTQLKRLQECGDLGMWNCAAYFIADDEQISKTAASTYQALIRGGNSGIEAITINTWRYDDASGNSDYFNLVEYLKKLTHPRIEIGGHIPFVTPTSLVSSSELTIQAGLPQKSVSGLTVTKYASFGREVLRRVNEIGSTINLGKINHMGNDERINVDIDCQSLVAHTLITGSTGSGKSNAVYKIISTLRKKKVPFLVIESAKGEYKNVFGSQGGISVFGTNPAKTDMLKINPFKFPPDIHILEHIDRLIEIFNVCWPMYAAMPAILKDAVERAYVVAGWDLDTSINKYAIELFPNFYDLLAQLNNVINESDFSQELKSNYIGALVTRVKSLTNGINGQLFVSDEINNDILFDSDVIVDLSRVASIETKAMIMGILVMKLQEYRIADGGMNRKLRHVTVLEEAHNLLKRTSTEQISEGANLLGKSVEMLANSIAEMRTYGEGFIIVDQSPNMLDMSVIRNTNTKIILRLPDLSDRELVGRSVSLNDEQIVELAKLPTGVATVFQNDWLEPVLCHVDRFEAAETEYCYQRKTSINKDSRLRSTVIRCLLGRLIGEKVVYSIEDIKERIFNSNFSTETKLSVARALELNNEYNDISKVSKAVSKLFNIRKVFNDAKIARSIEEWNELLITEMDDILVGLNENYYKIVLQCLIREISIEDSTFKDVYEKWTEYMRGSLI